MRIFASLSPDGKVESWLRSSVGPSGDFQPVKRVDLARKVESIHSPSLVVIEHDSDKSGFEKALQAISRSTRREMIYLVAVGVWVPEDEAHALDLGVDEWISLDGSTVLRDARLRAALRVAARLGVGDTPRTERALRAGEGRLALALSGSQLGLWDHNFRTSLSFVSEAWLKFLGFEKSDISASEMWRALVHEADIERVVEAFGAHVSGKSETFSVEHRVVTKSGEVRWVVSNGKIVEFEEDGSPLYAAGTMIDITERKLMAERLLISERMVSVGTLAAGVAHEINNPLAYVLANIDYVKDSIRRSLQDEAVKKGSPLQTSLEESASILDEAKEGATRVRDVVRDLRTFSRADDERVGPVDLKRVLESSISMAQNELRHRAKLIVSYGSLPNVFGNEGRLGQVFLNLLINAAQAIPAGHTSDNEVRVTTRVRGAEAVVEITDTGAGIPKEVLPRIFDPFFTTKPIGEGTGLGLSICHGIVVGMGGNIEVDSQVGRGTTVRIILPLKTTERRTKSGSMFPPSSEKRKVLVIDDDANVGKSIARLLSGIHDVTVVTASEAALTRLSKGEKFDVILCDLMMPEITGEEFYAELKIFNPEQASRVAFMTGGVFSPGVQKFLDSVPNPRLDKPFDQKTLLKFLAGS